MTFSTFPYFAYMQLATMNLAENHHVLELVLGIHMVTDEDHSITSVSCMGFDSHSNSAFRQTSLVQSHVLPTLSIACHGLEMNPFLHMELKRLFLMHSH